MQHFLSVGVSALLLTTVSSAVMAGEPDPTFNFTVPQFRTLFNEQAVKDEMDVIRAAITTPSEVEFKFEDSKFQRGVKLLKDMDVMNGKVTYLATMVVTVDKKSGFIKTIIVGGVRDDPINLFRTISLVGVIYEILNPSASEKAKTDFMAQLGLLRGDDDATIGQPMSSFSKGGAFSCNNQNSEVSPAFGCLIAPRS